MCIVCSRPCRTLSGAAAESAQYDRVKHDMCHQDASARLWPRTIVHMWPRTMPHLLATRRKVKAQSTALKRRRGGARDHATTPPTNGAAALWYSPAVPSAARWVASCPDRYFDVLLDCTTVCTTRATSRDVRCTRRSVRLHGWHVRDLSPYVVGTFAITKPGTVLSCRLRSPAPWLPGASPQAPSCL